MFQPSRKQLQVDLSIFLSIIFHGFLDHFSGSGLSQPTLCLYCALCSVYTVPRGGGLLYIVQCDIRKCSSDHLAKAGQSFPIFFKAFFLQESLWSFPNLASHFVSPIVTSATMREVSKSRRGLWQRQVTFLMLVFSDLFC